MKKNNVLLLLVMSILLLSCSNDDDNSNSTQIDITGNWIGTKFLIDEPYDLNKDGVVGTDYKVELPCLIQNITFNDDGTGLLKANIHSLQIDGTMDCVEYEEISIIWELNSNRTAVLVTAFDETIEIKIVSESMMERYSDSLLDEEIGISGKIVYEKE